ncbi:hypothetical protein UA08_00907 [Talaromyces atroroseus]|uniref:Uncharacterized protein n=1 Tax=Talaromyces atroroseus TaxID=1441469 RepID=A0A225AQ25_TALAT|nr:hypothetical protein UA08_00907 [Talaromyces atroroseus]OKL63732.1 hypothetical protein UA08_00907 [Talaromyces atroroseus]
MSPIPVQRPTLLDEDRVLSDQDVGLLYQIITRAEQNSNVERLPFRALFAAYDEVLADHGPDADPEQVCMRFLFKMGTGGLAGQSLFDRFENLLQSMGIILSFDDTEPEQHQDLALHPSALEFAGEQQLTGRIPEDTTQRSIRRRRASFNSMYDVGEDATQKHGYRPSSRSSMSRLDPGKSAFLEEIDDHPREPQTHRGEPTNLPDKNQLLAQFLEMGRRLMGGLDPRGMPQSVENDTPFQPTKNVIMSSSPRSNHRSFSERLRESDEPSPNIDINFRSEDMRAFDELGFKPSLSDMLRDASNFATYRRRVTARKAIIHWLEQAVNVRQRRQDMESAASNQDRATLLRQALDLWRAELQKKRQNSRTKRFFRHLERRAAKARDLYLMTKAFTHWAQLTSDEVSKASEARQHILSIKYFNAWREITAVNVMKAQRFTIRRPLDGWKRRIQQIRMSEDYAAATYDINTKRKYFMILRWNFYYEQRAPEWSDYRLKKSSFLSWIRALRTQREREADIDHTNRHELLHAAMQTWSYRLRSVNAAQLDADRKRKKKLVGDQIEVWSAQTRLYSAAVKTVERVNSKVVKTSFMHWRLRTKAMQEAKEADRLRLLRNAWTTWNDHLRCYALNSRIEERLMKEAIYRWVLAERYRLAQRIRDQRIQREAFTKFIITARDTSKELMQREDQYVHRYNYDILRSHLLCWGNKLAVQRQREYAAIEFYEPRVEQEALTIWTSRHQHVRNLEKWSQDARFYFTATKFVKAWHNATLDASKKRRQEAYVKIRRKVKMNIALSAIRVWYDKSRRVTNLIDQADEFSRTNLLLFSTELVDRWRQQTAKVAQNTQDAEVYYHRQLAYHMLTRWIDGSEKYRGLEEQADGLDLVHVSDLASAQLRKISRRIFQIRSAADMAESMHDRILRKHHRNMLRHWSNKARVQHKDREELEPDRVGIVTHEPTTPGAAMVVGDPENTLNLSELGSLPEHRLASTTPIATPGYLASPSRRAARARLLSQMSTTPATPLFTPFASRLRAALDGDRAGSESRARSRRSSVGTMVGICVREDPRNGGFEYDHSSMRAVLPGRPQSKLQALSTALWDDLRIVAYISGHALVVLTGAQTLLQTIYVDDSDYLETVAIDEASGQIAVSSGPDVYIYRPNGFKGESLKWSLAVTFRSVDDDEIINTLSWGSSEELLVANSSLSVWFLKHEPHLMWKKRLAGPTKFAEFSPDAELVATTGRYDRLVKLWRRLSFGADDVRFEVFYLPHPAAVTGIHWRRPRHREQSMENVLYTICADNKIRVWTVSDHQALSAMHLWTEIDMSASIQPRDNSQIISGRRYGFIIDSRDFTAATERAVQRNSTKNNLALEHLVEVATKSPEICVIADDQGHMCAWALENVGSKTRSATDVFNILHVEGLKFSFPQRALLHEDYARFYAFGASTAIDSLSILVHYFDGRIEWLDSQIDVLFDPTPRKHRLLSQGIWSGHTEPIKKIVRNASGRVLVSRTDDNNAMIWRQKMRNSGSILATQSSLSSQDHIHRTCVIDDGSFLINLHHTSISLWDIRQSPAVMLSSCEFASSSKPLCVLTVPHSETSDRTVCVAMINSEMKGIAWLLELPDMRSSVNSEECLISLREFCTFDMGLDVDVAYVLAVDPAGQMVRHSGFLDLFAADIALSYTHKGTIHTWAAKVDKANRKLDWLITSTVETGVINPSLASGSAIRKAALVDQDRTHLTIWDTSGAQLEFEERFPDHDMIRDLDWASTPDQQSILAVGFSHKVLLLSQLRYDYLDSGPSWTAVREIRIRDLTPHPIGDSCWSGNGNLVVGAGNQLFVYDKAVEADSHLVSELRIPARGSSDVNLFDIVSRLNGPLPVYHPQFLAQCILSGKTNLVHLILMNLHKKLKFYSEGDDLDTLLGIPVEEFYRDDNELHDFAWKEMRASLDYVEDEPRVLDETVAAILNENLTRISLPQLSSQEQFRLVDTIECVATVEKHRRSMDANAARYLLFFRQHMLRRSQGVANKNTVSWREIVWAFHSGSQDILTDLVSRQFNGKILWKAARESGIFMWLSDTAALRTQLEIVARNEYTKTEEKNPVDCSLFYLALRKKNVLQGLWRMASWNREQAATQRLLANNFQEQRWKTAALKNAYALLGKRRFEYAAAFFLLADHLREAANVCINQIGDIQLAITITRAYEGDSGSVLKEILEEKVLGDAASEGNRWMASWAFWMLNRRSSAVRALISPVDTLIPPTPSSPGSPGLISLKGRSYLSNDPALVVLYRQIREKSLQTLKGATQIAPADEWAFVIRNARLYDRMGCDLLALDLVAHWEFLRTPPRRGSTSAFTSTAETDIRKLLRRRSSLVIADLPVRQLPPEMAVSAPRDENGSSPGTANKPPKPRPKPTTFEEPDTNSLLDSFGF